MAKPHDRVLASQAGEGFYFGGEALMGMTSSRRRQSVLSVTAPRRACRRYDTPAPFSPIGAPLIHQ